METSQPSRYWRWIFIVLEATLATSFILGVFVAPDFGWRGPFAPPALARAHAAFVVIAWLFLLIASPFFLRSLRGVALTGLIIALCVLGYFVISFK
jgi:hypothetical protein